MRKWIYGLVSGAAALAAGTGAYAQQDFSAVEIKVHHVSANVYYLEGSGGNIGLSIGDDGAFIIDDQFAPLTPKIKAAIETVTDKPVKFLVNSHHHGDHAGGNAEWGDMGAVIVAQDNVRGRLMAGNMAASGLPVLTFTEEISFHWNGDDIEVHHLPSAHTDGDAFIYFKNANVIHGGDVGNMASYPFIDINSGGSYDGYIAAQRSILAAMGPDTVMIPGHGTLTSRAELASTIDMLVTIRGRVADAKADGKSLDQVKAMTPTAEYDARWAGFIAADQIIEAIYREMP